MDYLSFLSFRSPAAGASIAIGGLAFILLGATVFWYTNRRRDNDVHRLRQPPHPHWFWGHELTAWETPDLQFWKRNISDLGFTYAMKGAMMHPDIVIVADPAALNHMFTKHPYRYDKGAVFRPMAERMAGRGLVWANGSEHKYLRQIIAPFFTHNQVRETEDVIYSMMDRFVELLESRNQFATAVELDVQDWVARVALDIIGTVAFGFDFGCGETDIARYVLDFTERQANLGMTKIGFAAPLVLRAIPWATDKLFSFTDAQAGLKNAIKKVGREVLVKRRMGTEEKKADLLETLMQTMNVNNPAEMDYMLDQIVTMMLAGSETLAKTSAKILLELAKNPALQQALREEINAFEGSRPDGRPTYDEFLTSPGLKLLDAVVKESLRLYPVLNSDRTTEEDDIIPLRYPVKDRDGKEMTSLRVKKGQAFAVPTIVVNVHPDIWGEDGTTFDPYRWLDPGRLPPANQVTEGINGHFSFIAGPRLCVGYRLAIFEMKVILCELLRKFEFMPVPGKEIRLILSVTFQPYVEGEKDVGARLPLLVKQLRSE